MKNQHALPLVFALAAGLSACVIDTIPMPEDSPHEDDRGVDNASGVIQTNAIYFSADPVVLVGGEGAVPGEGVVIINNLERELSLAQTASADDGSFALRINASVGDLVRIEYASDGVVIDSIEVQIAPGSVAAFGVSDDFNAAPGAPDGAEGDIALTVSAPDDLGLVTVTAPSGSIPAGIDIVIANLDSSNAVSARASNSGGLYARIAAESGDELVLFAVEPASSNGGGTTTTVFVP